MEILEKNGSFETKTGNFENKIWKFEKMKIKKGNFESSHVKNFENNGNLKKE